MPEYNLFRLGPFVLRSEIDLPELSPAAPHAAAQITVRKATVPHHLAAPLLNTPVCEATAEEYLLRVAGTAQYYVAHGREVIIQPDSAAPAMDVRAYLLGSIFAVLCHQRGLLPLHASAVATSTGTIAFLGDSGSGKSSLAAVLGRRGYRIVADDICLIDPNAPPPLRVLPVAPWLKLWDQTLNHLGEVSAEFPKVFSSEEKFRLALDQPQDPLALVEVVLLAPFSGSPVESSAAAEPAAFRPLSRAAAIGALMRFTYRSYLPQQTGQAASHFQRCGRALEGVRAFELARAWGFAHMNAVVDALEMHIGQEHRPR